MPEPENGTDLLVYRLCHWSSNFLRRIHPNYVTVVANLLTVPLIYNLHYHRDVIEGVILIGTRSFLDCLDGTLARRYNKTSKFGALLDVYGDLVSITLVLGTSVYTFYFQEQFYLFCITTCFILGTLYYLGSLIIVEKDQINYDALTNHWIVSHFHNNQFLLGITYVCLFKFMTTK